MKIVSNNGQKTDYMVQFGVPKPHLLIFSYSYTQYTLIKYIVSIFWVIGKLEIECTVKWHNSLLLSTVCIMRLSCVLKK